MTRLYSQPSSLTYQNDLAADTFALQNYLQSQGNASESEHCLIVIIPTGADYTALTRRIWELANATSTRVLLLGLCNTADEEPSLRRQLVTMSALMGNGKVSTEAKVEIGKNCLDAVMTNYQAGDMIVCMAEQCVGLSRRPLNQILAANLNAPVYLLSDFYPQKSKPNWFSQVVVWAGFIAIIIGFGILQIRITQLPNDWFQNVLFIISILPEFWLIWVWNSFYD